MPFHCSEEDGVFLIRASGVLRMEDVQGLLALEERYFATPGCKGLFLCDATELKVISPDGAEALIAAMRGDNPRMARSAFIVVEGSTAALQLKRMIRDAGSPDRATFATEPQARAWLSG
jgi:hypothetical protein